MVALIMVRREGGGYKTFQYESKVSNGRRLLHTIRPGKSITTPVRKTFYKRRDRGKRSNYRNAQGRNTGRRAENKVLFVWNTCHNWHSWFYRLLEFFSPK